MIRLFFAPRNKGQGLVEYAILVIVVVGIALAAVALFGTSITDLFGKLATAINAI